MKPEQAKQKANEIREQGYCILPELIPEDVCNLYIDLLERDYQRWSPSYVTSSKTSHNLNDKGCEKVVYNMHNKDLRYFDLFDQPAVLDIVGDLLQEGSYQNSEAFNLLNISARNPAPYAPSQQLHLDSNLPGRGGYPLIIVALFMLEDFTEVNGATRFVPGSHRFDGYAKDGVKYDEEVRITGKKGSVLLFDGSLWHGSSEKLDDSSRWAVILGYGRWFIKPSFDFRENTPANIYEHLSESRKRLLGLDSYPPVDEFKRITRRSDEAEWRPGYELK